MSRIKPRMYMYVRRNDMYKKASLLAGTGVRKNSTVACWFSPIKTHHFVNPKRFINRKMKFIFFSL